VTTPGDTDSIAQKRARLAEIEAELARLRERYDLLMNAFRFEAARAIHVRIEAAERERRELAALLPPLQPEPPPTPCAVAQRRRRHR
jgi:hypothetical protein